VIRRSKVTKNVKRATLVLALTPLLAAPATVAAAAVTTGPVTAPVVAPVTSTVTPPSTATPSTSTTTTPSTTTTTTTTHTDAPPASASAVAAKVDGVITVGETSATAGNGSGTAHADALDLLGSRVSGGDVTNGSQSGNVFATPDNPIGDLEIAPWSATVTHDGGGTQSQAEAALAHAGLLGELQIWLLHSQSQATWTPDASHGHSQSDAAEVNLADQLDVKVLHAETDSNGQGSSAVLVVNGTGVLTSDQTGNQCVVDADPLVKILCLQAAGGTGSDGTTTATATVADVTSQSGLPEIVASGTKSSGGKVAAPVASTTSNQRGPLPHTSGPSSSSSLPFTGAESALVAAIGALLTAMGAWITTVTGRRRRAGALA
jgi:hypothetical protein